MTPKMSTQGFLILTGCLSALVLLGWMSHLTSTLHQLRKQGDINSALTGEHMVKVDVVREKRAVRKPGDDDEIMTDLGFGGAVYVRWGRLDCPVDTQLVYKGFIAGTLHTYTGGGSNLLCISDEPEFGNLKPGSSGYSYIYGAEFAGPGPDILFEHDHSEKLMYHDGTCAVCRSTVRASYVMIPGRLTCTTGWVKEYHGYLMGALHTAKGQANYICVDAAPQVDNRSFKSEGGVQLYPVEATCGTMPCPKYEAGKELTCVICTK